MPRVLPQQVCPGDAFCGSGQFCDLHYHVCRPRVIAGGACRRDAMCVGDHECRWGVCEGRRPKGSEGARCRRGRECGEGLCCARRDGEQVCQRLLPRGASCFVPDGGAEFAFNQQCPCQDGLRCRLQPSNRASPLTALLHLQNSLKCS